MAKLIIKRQPPRAPTEDDIQQAAAACQGAGTTARALAGRTGMPLRTAMAALNAAQKRDPYIRNEWVPTPRGSSCLQQLRYYSPG